MVLVTSNKVRQLLFVSYVGQVRVEEFQRDRADFAAQLHELAPGFSVLVDFSQMDTMDPACVTELGRVMELIGQAKVGLVVRVIPDPSKDIGLNILGAFHYGTHPRLVTCQTLVEAGQALDL